MGYSITPLSIYQFTANEALGYHFHILQETSVLPTNMGKLLDVYRAMVNKLRALMRHSEESVKAYAAVKKADKRRVAAYSRCKTYLDAMARSFDPEVSKAAIAIKTVFNNFKDVHRANDNEQTGILDNLVIELEKIDASVHEKISFTPWLTELKEAQSLYVTAVHDQNAAQEIKRRAEVRKAKDDCESAYKALINRVNAMGEMADGDDTFDTTFIKNVNVFIEGVKESRAKAARDRAAAKAAKAAKAAEAAKEAKEAEEKKNTAA